MQGQNRKEQINELSKLLYAAIVLSTATLAIATNVLAYTAAILAAASRFKW
jgi:thiosulfate reductase cytochrome b subunit